MTNYIFHEPSPGLIAHTAASRMLAEDGPLQAWVGFNSEDIFPAAAHSLQSLQTYPEGTELTRTGFNFAFNTVNQEPMFVTFGKDPARAKRMGGAMASLTGGEGYEVRHFVDNYDLSDVDAKEGTFVDVGGSHGFVCVDLGKKWNKTKFVVQDLQKTVDSAPKPISPDEDVSKRITLQAHDFFTEQPVHGADGMFDCYLDMLRILTLALQSTSSAGSFTTTQLLTPSRSSRASSRRSSPVLASSSTTTAFAMSEPRTPGTRRSCAAWTW